MQLSAEMFSQIVQSLHSDEATSSRHEKRREGRVGVRCSVDITPKIFDNKGLRNEKVKVRDISPSGMGFVSHIRMNTGMELVCKLPYQNETNVEVNMTVRHCVQVSQGLYIIGVSFDASKLQKTSSGKSKDSQDQVAANAI